MQIYCALSEKDIPDQKYIGSKASALMNMLQQGINVPHGFVLTTSFFLPWINQLQANEHWQALLNAQQEQQVTTLCRQLKNFCETLNFSLEQGLLLDQLLNNFANDALLAIRASITDEDIDLTDFLGTYQTALGIQVSEVKQAILEVFSSCFDARIILHKQQQGQKISAPALAIIIQEQIVSDIAGLGFSINPDNDHNNQVVFQANWGLGHSVVNGNITPDQFIIDKKSHKIIERILGEKETSSWLDEQGNITEVPDLRKKEFSLNDHQVLELIEQLKIVEELYNKPVSIEWAIADHKIYLLKAHTIASTAELPSTLLVEEGESPQLNANITDSILGLDGSLSPLGSEWLNLFLRTFSEQAFSKDIITAKQTGMIFIEGGQCYANITTLMNIFSEPMLKTLLAYLDPKLSESLTNINLVDYKTQNDTKTFNKLRKQLIFSAPKFIWHCKLGKASPLKLKQSYQQAINKFVVQLNQLAKHEQSIELFAQRSLEALSKLLIKYTLPTFVTDFNAKKTIDTILINCPDEIKNCKDDIQGGFPGNVRDIMAISLEKLADMLKDENFSSLDEIEQAIHQQTLPVDTLHTWKTFMAQFGFLGQQELDIANQHFHEKPMLLLQQIGDKIFTDHIIQDSQKAVALAQQQRETAHEHICTHLQNTDQQAYQRYLHAYEQRLLFAGLRSSHRYYLMMANDLLRRKILTLADNFVKKHRLEHQNDIFKLSFDKIVEAQADESLDLYTLIGRDNDTV